MASAPRDGNSRWHRNPPSPVTSPVVVPTPPRSRRSSRTSSLLRPRSRSSSSVSSTSSQPNSPLPGGTTSSHGSTSSLFIPSFTSTYHSQTANNPSIQLEPSINEGLVFNDHGSIQGEPAPSAHSDLGSITSETRLSGTTVVNPKSYAEGEELTRDQSIESSSDSLSTLSSMASNTIPNTSHASSSSTTHSVLRRAVPPLAATKFTALAQQYPSSRQTTHSPTMSSSSLKLGGFSSFRRNSSSGHRNSSTVSLILEDTPSSGSSTKSHGNKLRKKVSTTSLSGLTSKGKNSSSSAINTSSASSFGARAREQPKSRFSFLQPKHTTPPPPPPPPLLTGGPRQPSSHHYKVLPSENGSNSRPTSPASSSGSSSTSLSSSQSMVLGHNSSASASQQTLFQSTSKSSDGQSKSRKPPISPLDGRPSLALDVRRLSFTSQSPPPLADKQHKHHLLLRPRKESHPGTILSSSSSNSKLTSDAGSLYSFNPASAPYAPFAPYGLQKSISTIDVKTLSYKDMNKIPEQALEDVWPFLCARVTPLFTGDGLRVPVEDLNKLVLLHTKRRISEHDPSGLITDVRDLLRLGISAFDMTAQVQASQDSQIVEHVAELWQFYHASVLPYVRAVFVPLQLEFDGVGSLMSVEEAAKFWERQKAQPVKMNNIKTMTLASFRDWVILPLYLRLSNALSSESPFLPHEVYPRLIQCLEIISTVKSNDDKQQKVENLAKLVRELWMTIRLNSH